MALTMSSPIPPTADAGLYLWVEVVGDVEAVDGRLTINDVDAIAVDDWYWR